MPLHRTTHNALCLSGGLSSDRSAVAGDSLKTFRRKCSKRARAHSRSRPISRRRRQRRRPPLFSDNIALATGRKSRLRGASVQISNLPNGYIGSLCFRYAEEKSPESRADLKRESRAFNERRREKLERFAIKVQIHRCEQILIDVNEIASTWCTRR